jgi:hypothetical protein
VFAFPFVVTVSAAGVGVDDYGNPVPSAWTSATARGDIQPVRTDETIDGISSVEVDEVRFYLETGTVVAAGDRLTVDDVTYEAIGPADSRVYGGRLDYVRIRARRTEP